MLLLSSSALAGAVRIYVLSNSNTDGTTGHTCAGSSPTGATMSYDAHGQMANWTAPSGTVGSAHYLYDAEGNRVLTNSANASATTDTIYFDGYTETVLTGGTTTTTKYYSANGSRVAVRIGGSTLDYLMSDPLGSNSVALNDIGQVIAFQHYSPYGTGDYTWGTMPTSYNYAGERLDSQTGLLYDNFRYYDPLVGRFVRSDDVQDNSTGMDPYAYVGDNPETRNDPTGHCWPWCTMAVGAVLGAAIGAGASIITQAASGKGVNWSKVAVDTVAGAVGGAITGLAGPQAGLLVTMAAGAAGGAAGGAIGQVGSNLISGKPLGEDVLEATLTGAVVGGLTAGAFKGAGKLLNKVFAGSGIGGRLGGAIDALRKGFGTKVGDFAYLAGKTLGDVIDRLPTRAGKILFKLSGPYTAGVKYEWYDGANRMWMYAHNVNPLYATGPEDWIFRLQQGMGGAASFLDNTGSFIPKSAGGYKSPATHIPIWR